MNEIVEKVVKLKESISETENRIPEIDSCSIEDAAVVKEETILVNGEGAVQNGHIDSAKEKVDDVDKDKDKDSDNLDKDCISETIDDSGNEVESKDIDDKELSDKGLNDDKAEKNEETNTAKLNGNASNENENVTNDIENSIKEPDKVDDLLICPDNDQSSDKNVDDTEKVVNDKTDGLVSLNDTECVDSKSEKSSVVSVSDEEKAINTESVTECPNEEAQCSGVSECDTPLLKEENSQLNDSQPVELVKISGELAETCNSNSSGPPSLIKEVISEDNSVTSDTGKIEETMITDDVVELKSETKSVDLMSEAAEDVEDGDKKVDSVVLSEFKENSDMSSPRKTEKTKDLNDKSAEGSGNEEPVSVESKTTKVLSSKSQKLDILLSKITNKAESDSQKVMASTQPPKQAKARKSCANSSSLPIKASQPQSLTSLTFNVKELEKKGVLDMPKPKPSKRKAFEPIKIPSPDKDKQKSSPPRKLSPLKSPVKSPGKTENPFFNKQKLLTRRKKKSKRSGGYKLPGEKSWKRNKSKRSEERQLKPETQKVRTDLREGGDSHSTVSRVEENMALSVDASESVSYVSGAENKLSPGQTNALDLLTKNSSKSFLVTNTGKKAKKTVKGIDPLTNRTLDNFLKTGSHANRKVHVCIFFFQSNY